MHWESFPEKHGTTCWELRSICPKVDTTSVEFISCDFHSPLSSKRQTNQLLDHKNNPLECWKKSLKRLEKSSKRIDKPLERKKNH